jgi:hypothetical protein
MRTITLHPGSAVLLILLAVLAGATGGAVFGQVGVNARPPVAVGPPPNLILPDEFHELLGTLVQEVRDLRETLMTRESVPERRQVPETKNEPAPALDELTVQLERLVKQLESAALRPGAVHTPRIPLQVPPGGVGFESPPWAPDFGDRESREAWRCQVARDFRFLTYQEVLSRYGNPDYVSYNEGHLYWRYENEETEQDFEFAFVDGFVIWTR